MHQYLCVVPQERKFCNPLTGDVIAESARWMPDFSAVKAAQAFTAMETYASNVINQPWRVEFREIKVTFMKLDNFKYPIKFLRILISYTVHSVCFITYSQRAARALLRQ